MGSMTVKVPDEMESEVDGYLDRHPYYLNRSEFVRDAVRRILEEDREPALSPEFERRVEQAEERGEFVPLEDV